MKLIAMLQVYNEVENGNLERCLMSLKRYCDAIQVYDDGSTDGPHDLYRTYDCDVIWSDKNDFVNELTHKQAQLDRCKELGADWIWRIDADEVIECFGGPEIRGLCEDSQGYDSWAFHMVNLWRNPAYYRTDSCFNDVVFNRLWRVPLDGLKFNVQKGLHLTNYPIGATSNEGFSDLEVLHYGFASDQAILDKYNMYKKHGQDGWALWRLIDETCLTVRPSKSTWFPKTLKRLSRNQVFGTPIASMVQDA